MTGRSWKLSLIVSSIRGPSHCCQVQVLLMSVISYRSVTDVAAERERTLPVISYRSPSFTHAFRRPESALRCTVVSIYFLYALKWWFMLFGRPCWSSTLGEVLFRWQYKYNVEWNSIHLMSD